MLKQESTVAEYREKFEDYSAPLENLDNAILEGKFVDGLKEDIKFKLHVCRPVGFDAIMDTTRKMEDELLHFEDKYFEASFTPKLVAQGPNQTSSVSKPVSYGAGSNTRTVSINPSKLGATVRKEIVGKPSEMPFKKLTDVELQIRREKELCY